MSRSASTGYVRVGGRTGWCPLVEPADAVVVDLRLLSEDTIDGAAAELLDLCTSSGKAVVAFGPDPAAPRCLLLAWSLGHGPRSRTR